MAFADYRKDLLDVSLDVNYVLDKYFHSGESQAFHGAGPDAEARLKNELARAIYNALGFRVHPFQLVICGSAHLGFSPVPAKLGQPFDTAKSDIDFAVISPDIFEVWWTELQTGSLDEESRGLISQDLFWGFINPANVPESSEIKKSWWKVFGGLKTDRAKGVRGRLYKSFWSMQSYHGLAVKQGRYQLRSAKSPATRTARASSAA